MSLNFAWKLKWKRPSSCWNMWIKSVVKVKTSIGAK